MVKKIHTQTWRYAPLGRSRNRKKRMKTFLSEKEATEHAKILGLKKYKVIKSNFGLSKKFKIVLE